MKIDRTRGSAGDLADSERDEDPSKHERDRSGKPGSASRAGGRRMGTGQVPGEADAEGVGGVEGVGGGTSTSRDDGKELGTAGAPQGQGRDRKPAEAASPESVLERMRSHGGFANLAEEFDARATSRKQAGHAVTAAVAAVPGAGREAGTRPRGDAAGERPRQVSAAGEPDADTGREDAGGEDSAYPPFARRFDVPIEEDGPSPREVLERFDPARANLPEVSVPEAVAYIDQNADRRPWLAAARGCDPVVQRVIAAMDLGQGHALERHEGYADDGRLIRRVTVLEDPAQLDPEKRAAGIDGCKPGNRDHRCGRYATAIHDPDAFATAFVRGTEHPEVREVLESPYDPEVYLPDVSIPIEELLGADGPRYCTGYRLAPIAGDTRAAMDCREAWVDARANDRDPDVPPPRAVPVDSFDDAEVKFFFRPTRAKDGYEIATMYVVPSDEI